MSSLQIAAGKAKAAQQVSPPRKGRVGNTPVNLNPRRTKGEEIWQHKKTCAAGNACKMKDLPLFPERHRCGACGFAMHVPCGIESTADDKSRRTQSTVFQSICLACIHNRKWSRFTITKGSAQFLAVEPGSEPRRAYDNPKAPLKLVESNDQGKKKARQAEEIMEIHMTDAGNKTGHPATPQRNNSQAKKKDDHQQTNDDMSDESSTGDQTVHMATTNQKNLEDPKEERAGPPTLGPNLPSTGQLSTKGTVNPNESTPTRDMTMTRKFLDIKVPIGQPTENDAGAGYRHLKQRLVAFFQGIHQLIPSFKICELRSATPELDSKIHDLTRFPERLDELRKYLRQAYIPSRGSDILYTKILAEWEGTEADLRDLEWWMSQHNMALYVAKLQTPDHMRVGWLLYSVQSMGADDLTEALKQVAKRKYGIRDPMITMRWSRIPNKEKAQPEDPKAMQLDVAYHQVDDVKRMLKEVYSPTAKEFPLHMRMRFVTGLDDLVDPTSVAKFNRLRARQGLWVAQSVGRVTQDIMNIDHVDPRIGKSLRDMIYEIPAASGATHTPLIHSIGRHYRGGYYYTCHPRKVAEAQMVISGLYARLWHTYQEQINAYFTPGGIRKAAGMTYDPATGRVRTDGDTIIENIEMIDQDLILEEEKQDELAIPQREVLVEERTLDSISTLEGGGATTRHEQREPKRSTRRNTGNSATDTRSVASLQSRVSSMEDTLSVIMSTMQSIQTTLTAGNSGNPATPQQTQAIQYEQGIHRGDSRNQGQRTQIISPSQNSGPIQNQSASAGQADNQF